MSFKRIVVLGGGLSNEREVSLRSAKAVFDACLSLGHEAVFIDPKENPEFINKLSAADDIVLPILHGVGGEDGSIQKQLEMANVRFLGSGSSSSRFCFDKNLTRELLAQNDLPIADGAEITKSEYSTHPLAKRPHVLKDPIGGSSIGTIIIETPSGLDNQAVEELFEKSEVLLIEELIKGTEVTVAILGGQTLPLVEIIPPAEGGFDYLNKYNGKTTEICPPESVSLELQKQCQELALKTHQLAGCRHFSRVDLMISQLGRPVILEINTIPGLTSESLFPKAAQAASYSFELLTAEFIKMAEVS